MADRQTVTIGGCRVRRGVSQAVRLEVSQRYTGDPVHLPLQVIRGPKAGPIVFVTAAVHGDELNGMGIVHELMFGEPLDLLRGTLLLVPVLNIFGIETQNRYLPDRRDLNRCFPGSASGSLTHRLARVIFDEIVQPSDFGIDLHSASVPRTNFPNVRGNLKDAEVRRLAKAFGCELMVHSVGPTGSLRREATKAGCPTIILEAGETNKIEPGVQEVGVRGIQNVLKALGLLGGRPVRPAYQMRVDKGVWVRAEVGGILRFHVSPGDLVEEGQPIATNASVFGEEQNTLVSPVNGIVLSVTTLPTVKPGETVCHIAVPGKSMRALRQTLAEMPDDSLHERMREDLATNISVSEHEGDWASDAVTDD